jgi:hypothetical protein
MFTRYLTGTPPPHGSVHGLLLIDKLKTLSIFANSNFATPIPAPGIKGFTGSISISYNKTKGVHGFTGLAPYSPLCVQSSRFKVQGSRFCLCLCLSRTLSPTLPAAPTCPARASSRRRKSDEGGSPFNSRLKTQDSGLQILDFGLGPAWRYVRYGLVRVAVRVRHQYHPMITGLGTMVRLQPPTGHPPAFQLRTQGSGLRTQDSGLRTQDFGPRTLDPRPPI